MKIHVITSAFILISYFPTWSQAQYDQDVKSVENITQAYYEVISGPIGEERDFDRLKNLFHPNATFTYSYWSTAEDKANLMEFDFDGYVEKLDYLDKKGFYEEEISNQVTTYGTLVNVISTYKFWMEDKTAEGRGVTFYNYFYDGERYWIMSMLWQMESEQFPIPETFIREGD